MSNNENCKKDGMRDCMDLINLLKDGNHDAEWEFIVEISKRKDIFIGVRNKSINVYSYGASVLKIEEKDGDIIYKTHWRFTKYISNDVFKATGSETYQQIEFAVVKGNFDELVCGANETYIEQNRHEKICQQWIVNMTNNDPNCEWLYVDMEYNTKGERLGRFDMIAISKKPNVDGMHKVCLVELKVGSGSYTGQWDENDDLFQRLKNGKMDLFSKEAKALKFGSGIVGHIADFERFLYEKNYYKKLCGNIRTILKCQEKIGIYNKNQFECEIDELRLADKPEILIVSYTDAPQIGMSKANVLSMKKQLRKYLVSGIGCSKYSLQNALADKNISGFNKLSLKYKDFSQMKDVESIEQQIGEEKYKFSFAFVDTASERSWDCIK